MPDKIQPGLDGLLRRNKDMQDGTFAETINLAGQSVINAGFSASGTSVLDAVFNPPIVGSGVTYNQGAGSLNVLSGTTANAEFLARSVESFESSMRLRFSLVASQRIANSNFAVLLADLIGENLTYTIVSATSVNVRVPAHGFTALMVGQFVLLGGITGAAGAPGRYAIGSIVDADTINFTVSGWPASGRGTCTLFGRNYVRQLVTGTTATTLNVDCQRNGWAAGDTGATINTTASPGTVVQVELTGREIFWSDSLRASSTTPNFTTRASRFENIPESTLPLFVFLWNFNGSTAPASTTTFTLAHLSVENFNNVPVYLQGNRSLGQQNALPVALLAGSNTIGDVGVQYRATASGASATHLVAAATTNATLVKNAAGKVLGWYFVNTTTAWVYVKLHNSATAPTAGAGVVRTIGVPPDGAASWLSEGGITFATGIGLTTVTGAGDTDATAVAANSIVGELIWA